MKYIPLLLVANLLYCLEILLEMVLKRVQVFAPEPVALGILMGKEIVFLTLLYSLTSILRKYGEKKSIIAALYFFMVAITMHATVRAFFQAEPLGLTLLALVSEIYLVYQCFRVRHPHIKRSYRLVGAALVLSALLRSLFPVMVIYAGGPNIVLYTDLAFLLPPLAILLLHLNYNAHVKQMETF